MRVSNGLDNGDNSEDGGKWAEFEKFMSICLKQIDCLCLIFKITG